jgi:hypothetical protein
LFDEMAILVSCIDKYLRNILHQFARQWDVCSKSFSHTALCYGQICPIQQKYGAGAV